jgi:hypothetical protein
MHAMFAQSISHGLVQVVRSPSKSATVQRCFAIMFYGRGWRKWSISCNDGAKMPLYIYVAGKLDFICSDGVVASIGGHHCNDGAIVPLYIYVVGKLDSFVVMEV